MSSLPPIVEQAANEPEHADLAPSSASRWSICTASPGFIKANRALLPPDGSVYADEGTRAHAHAKAILLHTLGQSIKDVEMRKHVEDYVAFVRRDQQPGDRLLVEQRVPLFYNPKQKGTLDASVISLKNNRGIWIKDLKYGAGVSVYAEENKQLSIYGESLIRELEAVDDLPDDLPITLEIFQPRDRNNSEPVRFWTITRAELRDFTYEQVQIPAQKIAKGDVKFVADHDNQCKFCPAKGICKHYAAEGLKAFTDEAVDVVVASPMAETLPVPDSLTREQRQRVIKSRKALEGWLEAVEEQEKNELLAGAEPIDFKLVEGKTNRVWADEAAAAQLLSNHLSMSVIRPPSDVISPAAAEKALKGIELSTRFENAMAKLISKPQGKPSLVPITDKRPALNLNAKKDFGDEDCI